MDLVIALVVGAVAGTHIATWGMYKDAPHEGYSHRKYSRAIVFSAFLAFVFALVVGPNLREAGNLMVFFGCVYAVERGLEEIYKTFFREEDQSKYFIPMQFHIFGRLVQNRLARWSVGTAWVLLAIVGAVLLTWLERTYGRAIPLPLVVLLGGAGGWMSAAGGAAKDAPIEGFEILKFFRSPLLASTYAFLLAHFTSSLVLIAVGGIGYTVATIETYKTFFFPNKPRGKFAGKPILFPEMLVRRQRYVPLYAAIWVVIIVGFVVAFVGPHRGRV